MQPTAKETAREIRSGVRYVSNIPWLWVTITLFAVILMLQLAPQQVLMPELVHEHFDRGVGAYGFLVTMFGAGTVTGTLLFGQLQPRKRRGVVNYSFWLLNSLAIAALALSPWFQLAAFVALVRGFCVGFGVAMWETCKNLPVRSCPVSSGWPDAVGLASPPLRRPASLERSSRRES